MSSTYFDLRVLIAITVHYDLRFDGVMYGQLHAMGTDDGGPFPRNGTFQIVERLWQSGAGAEGAGRHWHESTVAVSPEMSHRLVARIQAAWADGRAPRITCTPTSATASHSLTLSVSLLSGPVTGAPTKVEGTLSIAPTDGLGGPDSALVRALLHDLAEAGGLLESRHGFPVEVFSTR